jgi:hypothetical protein
VAQHFHSAVRDRILRYPRVCNIPQGIRMKRRKPAEPLTKKQDLIHLAILLVISLAIGVYLVTTTVVITKDGTWYIEQAKKLSSDPHDVIKSQSFGFPLLILITYKLIALLSNSSSLSTWIYSAQSITLLCRVLSLIPLYFIGKLLFGGNRSFRAILILIILPYPAEFGSDVLRDWPHILFLASGFLFLIWAVKQGKYRMFGAAGFAAGLGHTIRPECAQLLIYGALWIFIRLFSPKPGMSRPRLLCALSVLLIGFAIPAAPYMTARGKFLPVQLKALISFAYPEEPGEIREPEINSDNSLNTTSVAPGKIVKGIGELAEGISENLMYFFTPALLIGIYFRFPVRDGLRHRKQSSAMEIERFFVPALAALNVVMLITLYYYWGYISRRHSLPLVVFTIFYVPIGLEVSAGWLANRFSPSRDGLRHKSRPASDHDRRVWFFILLITGTAICLPKLLNRSGSDNPGYRTAAAWLKENTATDDLIAVSDKRITFYAERKALVYETAPPRQAEYVVIIVKDEDEKPEFVIAAQEQYSEWIDKHKNKMKLVIYKMP